MDSKIIQQLIALHKKCHNKQIQIEDYAHILLPMYIDDLLLQNLHQLQMKNLLKINYNSLLLMEKQRKVFSIMKFYLEMDLLQ